jgi:hypothetical protein
MSSGASDQGATEASLPSIEELTGRDRDPFETVEETRRVLGIGTPRRRYRDGLPDVGGLAEDLGLA